MREEVYHSHVCKLGLKVNEKFLKSLEETFRQYNEKYTLQIIAECKNNVKYQFDTLDECFDFFDKNPYRIIGLRIDEAFGEGYNRNKIELRFNNGYFENIKAVYTFDNADEYQVQRNKVEQLMSNYKLGYYVWAKIPIVPLLLTLAFLTVTIYTAFNEIVFPRPVQVLILLAWIGCCFMILFIDFFSRMKRNIFPFVEFRIGQNEVAEEKNEKTRNFIGITLLATLVVSVIANIVSGVFL